jgi:hypothetical protein
MKTTEEKIEIIREFFEACPSFDGQRSEDIYLSFAFIIKKEDRKFGRSFLIESKSYDDKILFSFFFDIMEECSRLIARLESVQSFLLENDLREKEFEDILNKIGLEKINRFIENKPEIRG